MKKSIALGTVIILGVFLFVSGCSSGSKSSSSGSASSLRVLAKNVIFGIIYGKRGYNNEGCRRCGYDNAGVSGKRRYRNRKQQLNVRRSAKRIRQ